MNYLCFIVTLFCIVIIIVVVITRVGWCCGSSLDMYSGGAQFEFQPGHPAILTEIFVALLGPYKKIPAQYLA
jgi:hypothetical protein